MSDIVKIVMPWVTQCSYCNGGTLYGGVSVYLDGVPMAKEAQSVPANGFGLADVAPHISTDNVLFGMRGTIKAL